MKGYIQCPDCLLLWDDETDVSTCDCGHEIDKMCRWAGGESMHNLIQTALRFRRAQNEYVYALKSELPIGRRVMVTHGPYSWAGTVAIYPGEHDGTVYVLPDEPEKHPFHGSRSLLNPKYGVNVSVEKICPIDLPAVSSLQPQG